MGAVRVGLKGRNLDVAGVASRRTAHSCYDSLRVAGRAPLRPATRRISPQASLPDAPRYARRFAPHRRQRAPSFRFALRIDAWQATLYNATLVAAPQAPLHSLRTVTLCVAAQAPLFNAPLVGASHGRLRLSGLCISPSRIAGTASPRYSTLGMAGSASHHSRLMSTLRRLRTAPRFDATHRIARQADFIATFAHRRKAIV